MAVTGRTTTGSSPLLSVARSFDLPKRRVDQLDAMAALKLAHLIIDGVAVVERRMGGGQVAIAGIAVEPQHNLVYLCPFGGDRLLYLALGNDMHFVAQFCQPPRQELRTAATP